MQIFNLKTKNNQKILALGAELDSAFAYYNNGKVVISENTKNAANNPVLLEEKINAFYRDALQCVSSTPDCILTDLNPEYNTVKMGEKLAQKWQIPHIKIQHHHAHIFSVITEHYLLAQSKDKMPDNFIGIACDGTGYGTDETIWGGEIFNVGTQNFTSGIERIGHLQQQTLIGGQMAVEEPARMLMAILANFLNEQKIYKIINKFYNPKISKLLYSQLKQNFNCQKTSSCARILDAASALLFGCNERKFKHQATKILEDNSSEPYDDIRPTIVKISNYKLSQRDFNNQLVPQQTPQPPLSGGLREFPPDKEGKPGYRMVSGKGGLLKNGIKLKFNQCTVRHNLTPENSSALSSPRRSPLEENCGRAANKTMPSGSLPLGDSCRLSQNNISILQTTPLLEYLIKNLGKDKKRLAATVHLYIANGLLEIAKKSKTKKEDKIIFSGGMANNKIFHKYFKENGVLLNNQINPGDPGISLGQIGWYLMKYN